jgi:hypothetical protein
MAAEGAASAVDAYSPPARAARSAAITAKAAARESA